MQTYINMIGKYLSEDSICEYSCPYLVPNDAFDGAALRGHSIVQDEQD